MSSQRLRRAGTRLAAVGLGLLTFLVLLELGLQIVALFTQPEERAEVPVARPGERRILCIGDSNTYGVHLPPSASYPGQLQTLLDRQPGQPWRVFNLGYPGQNSAQVRYGLAENIAAYEPEIVIVWVGCNNTWSPAKRHLWSQPDGEGEANALEALLQESRAFGALRMLLHRARLVARGLGEDERASRAVPGLEGAERGAGVVPVELLDFRRDKISPSKEELRRSFEIDFRRMRELCAERGARLVMADYPIALEGVRDTVNVLLREVAAELGVPLVRLERALVPLADELGHDTLWLPDEHCTALGNYEVARVVLATLMERGLLEESEAWRTIDPLVELIGSRGLHVLARRGKELDVELRGTPGESFRVYLRGVGALPGGELREFPLPLAKLDYTADERAAWYGELDSVGLARRTLRLPPLRAPETPGLPLERALPRGARIGHWRLVPHMRPADSPPRSAQALPGVDVALSED